MPGDGHHGDDEGRWIGAYRVERSLGSGGMGEVVLAWDDRLERHVAIKRIRHDVETTPERRRRFRREARAAAGLSHPAIVQIHDILEDASGDAIVMEYVEGRSLAELLTRGAVDGPAAVRIGRQVAEGLARAHAGGLVHRDLKAENVMVTADGQAKILDFGLAKPLARADAEATLTREGAVVGTVRAMSPEQAGGDEVDARSDLFSLGVLLYEMLTGRSPFRGANALQVHRKLLTERPPPLLALRPELPAALSELVEALLEKDPDRRPGSAGDVARALEGLAPAVEGLGPAAPSPTRLAASDAATVAKGPSPSEPISRGDRAGPGPAAVARPRSFGRPWRLAAGFVALALAAMAVRLTVFQRPEAEPLRVQVLPPEVSAPGDDAELDLLAAGVAEAALATLFALRGLEVLDPSQLQESGPSAAAEELRPVVRCQEEKSCRVWFRRVRDGRLVGTAGPFDVASRPEYALDLANAVRAHLPDAYPRRRWRSEVGEPEIRPEDYAVFIRLRQRSAAGEVLGEAALERLRSLVETSPGLAGAYVLAAEVARTAEDPAAALGLVERARELVPWDPRPLATRVLIELGAGRLDDAETTLEELERLAPGDLRVWKSRAWLLEGRGRHEEALSVWKRVVERRPTWQHHHSLASLEMRLGNVEAARAHLAPFLDDSMTNARGWSKLAELEAQLGDLGEAERIYLGLIAIQPQRRYLANLGFVRFLQGRHAAATESFRRALEHDPDHRRTRLNLAEALLAAGDGPAARELHREHLAELDREELDTSGRMFTALCLARLGEARRAVEVTEEALARPDAGQAQVLFQAAVVATLVGQRVDALRYAERALELGLVPRWFEVPAFDPLRGDPAFQKLLEPVAPHSSSREPG